MFSSGTLIGLFSQIKTGGEEVRERAIKFLNLKIKTNSSDLLNTEAEGVLLEQISSIVEVRILLFILSKLPLEVKRLKKITSPNWFRLALRSLVEI